MTRFAVTGWSAHLPGTGPVADLPDLGPACHPGDAKSLLGRRGLLMKEPATVLALCAVHRALGMRPGERVTRPVRTDAAVVASSNLGNVATVVETVRTVASDGVRAVSPMSAPNASSNVLAGTVAIWFKLGGPNLMVCSGRQAGFDAIRLAALLLTARRATQVVVVGAEPDDTVARGVHGRSDPPAPLRAGAACVVLELGRGDVDIEVVEPGAPTTGDVIGRGGLDPLRAWGDLYGGQGVLEAVLAAQIAAQRRKTVLALAGRVIIRAGSPG